MQHTCGALTKKDTKCVRKVPFEDCKCYQHCDKDAITQCTICLDDITPEQKIKLKCHHAFHEKCIFNWLKKKRECPLCRQKISDRKTLQWMENFDEKDEEWLPETNIDIPTRRWRRLRRAASRSERRNISLMEHLSNLLDQLTGL